LARYLLYGCFSRKARAPALSSTKMVSPSLSSLLSWSVKTAADARSSGTCDSLRLYSSRKET